MKNFSFSFFLCISHLDLLHQRRYRRSEKSRGRIASQAVVSRTEGFPFTINCKMQDFHYSLFCKQSPGQIDKVVGTQTEKKKKSLMGFKPSLVNPKPRECAFKSQISILTSSMQALMHMLETLWALAFSIFLLSIELRDQCCQEVFFLVWNNVQAQISEHAQHSSSMIGHLKKRQICWAK